MRGAQNQRIGRFNRRVLRAPALVGFVALTTLTRHVAQAQEGNENYPYIGCFKDERKRVLKKQQSLTPLTLAACAEMCLADVTPSWKYAGLEFGQECFCGNEYDTYGKAENCDMVSDADTGNKAGGKWAISVYDLQGTDSTDDYSDDDSGYAAANALQSSASVSTSHSEGADIGGDTDTGGDGATVSSGDRSFTVVNQCSQTIRVGATGGRITFGTDADQTSEALCDAWGDSSVYNSGPMGIGCYWDLPAEASGNTDRELGPGESFIYPLHETASDTRWSGTIWASTGCDKVDGCATGVCYSPDTGYVCPAYVGPGGPTTKAEFTLSDGGSDYYDVSAIDGTNLPMMIEPDNPNYPDIDAGNARNIQLYECGSPGAPTSPTGLGDCSWSYANSVEIEDGEYLSQYLRLVLPDDYTEHVVCETDANCGGHTCGVHPQRWANGAYRGGVTQGSCGEHIAWVSAGGACAGGWVDEEFPNAFPFFCGESVENGQRANMYGCHGGALAHSGYTPGADSTSCGCPDWQGEGLTAPSISDCNGVNDEWVEKAQPWAKHLKQACPTAYTFPYDDQTSTFICADFEDNENGETVNTQSYTITFCPGDSESAMFS